MKAIIYLITLTLSILLTSSDIMATDAKFTNQDKTIFQETIEKLIPYSNCDKNEIMVMVAKEFLGTLYVAGTLETIPEQLTVYLHQTDCILFVESCLAMTTLLSEYNQNQQIPTFDDYCALIQSMRYRNGKIDGYSSRIHYTSEWILQNEQNGLLEEYTSQFGERKYQTFSFMSTHPQSYQQLKNSPSEVQKIKEVEKSLDTGTKVYTISAENIHLYENEIQDGDIICFVSKVKGLDITHVGIAHRENGKLTFIHASSKYKKVIIEPKSLQEYCTTSIRVIGLK